MRIPITGKNTDSSKQIVGDRRAQHPRGVRPELPRRHVCKWSVNEIGEHGFNDRVPTVGDICVGGEPGGVGEKRVIPPDGETTRPEIAHL